MHSRSLIWLLVSLGWFLVACDPSDKSASSSAAKVQPSTSVDSVQATRVDSLLVFTESTDSLPRNDLGLLGFVEDRGDSSYVRVAFRLTEGEWESACNGSRRWWREGECERERSADTIWWSLVRARRVVGAVRAQGYSLSSRVSDRGLALIGETGGLPWNDARSRDFAGWVDRPVHRPLLATTFVDPTSVPLAIEGDPLGAELRELLWPHFKIAVGRAVECTPYIEGEEQEAFEWEYHVEDMEVVGIVQTAAGTRIVGLRTRPDHNECDGPEGLSRSTFWFRIGTEGGVSLLVPGANEDFAYEMTPLEAADVNTDGDPEYIFWLSGYNQDGYVLFSRDFTRQSEFLWSYH